MLKRDLAVLVLACIAMLVSLQNESGTFSFRQAWYHRSSDLNPGVEQELGLVEHPSLPQPLVVDLNGDGRMEVLLATPDYKLQVVEPGPAGQRGAGFAAARLVHQVSLLHRTVAFTASRRPVAMAAGYLDPLPLELVRAPRKQVVVVVTAARSVLCFDHNLKLLWEQGLGAAGEQAAAHTHIKQTAVLITPHRVLGHDRGLVVVGSSMAQGDLASGEGLERDLEAGGGGGGGGGAGVGAAGSASRRLQGDAFESDNVLESELAGEQRAAAHARSAGAGSPLQDLDQGPGRLPGLDTSRHFSYWALEGGAGAVRWEHTAASLHQDLLGEMAGALTPQNNFRLEAAKLEGRHFGEASCRDFCESLLHVLPHAWSDPLDTELAEARFVKHRPGRGAHKEGLGQAGQALAGQRAKRTALATAGAAAAAGGSRPPRRSGLIGLAQGLAGRAGSSSSSHHPPTQAVEGQGQGGRHSSAHKAVGSRAPHHHANISANAIVAYLEEGVEVVHLYSGRSICALHLQPGQLHADLNGDGVLDHVQVYRGAMSGGEGGAVAQEAAADSAVGSGRHRVASRCSVKATSGIPPSQQLWEVNICHSRQFLSRMNSLAGGELMEEEDGDPRALEVAVPIFLPLPQLNLGVRLPSAAASSRSKGQRSRSHAPHDHRSRQRHAAHGLVVVMTSRGDMTALNARGAMVWEAHHPVAWTPRSLTEQDSEEAAATVPHAPTLKPFALHTHGTPTTILAAGASAAVLLSAHGHALDTVWLPSPPMQPLVVGDFDGDGLTDFMAVTPDGLYAWSQVRALGASRLPSVMLVLLLGVLVVLWTNNASLGFTTGVGRAAKKRSTDVAD